MQKIFALIAFFLLIFQNAGAQCESCPPVKNYKSDYCYCDKEIPGLCVHFSAATEMIVIGPSSGKGALKEIAVPDSVKPDNKWLLALAGNKKLKLSVAEALLLQKAIPAWRNEKRYIGMQYTPSGLGYKITQEGTGKQAESGKKVFVHYRGTLEDGSEFDNSFKRSQPLSFNLGSGMVIKGWDEGIALLKEGGKAVLRIPPALGYGERGYPPVIPGNATLIFEVELVKVE